MPRPRGARVDNFQPPNPDWFFTGGAGYDIGKGFAREGANNAWVRGSTGWNAINRFHDVEPGETFTVYAWLRLSDTLTDGYFTVRGRRTRR